VAIPQRGGLPHSDIHGSTPARGSPWLFAACHVLHRLLVPRHPPNALLSLEIEARLSTCHPPCTETILSGHRPQRCPCSSQKSLLLSTQQSPLNTHCHRRDAEASGQTLRWQRPETHQNLIHPDKDRRLHLETPLASRFQSESSMPIAFASPRYSPEHLIPRSPKSESWWR
jgi:hypothetical protein